MNIGTLIGEAIATVILKQWIAHMAKQNRPPGYVWTEADITAFLSRIASDTQEAVLAEVDAEVQ